MPMELLTITKMGLEARSDRDLEALELTVFPLRLQGRVPVGLQSH